MDLQHAHFYFSDNMFASKVKKLKVDLSSLLLLPEGL